LRSPLRKLRLFDEKPTAKRALSVLRTAATGRTLLARGELVTDVGEMREYMPDGIDELLAIKRTAEQQQLERSSAPRGAAGSSRRFDAVDAACRRRCCRPSLRSRPSRPPTPGCARSAATPGSHTARFSCSSSCSVPSLRDAGPCFVSK